LPLPWAKSLPGISAWASCFRFRQSGHATAALEFVLLAPMFLLLQLGRIAPGVPFGASHALQQISAAAAHRIIGIDKTEQGPRLRPTALEFCALQEEENGAQGLQIIEISSFFS
jgi:Flp pilus assembly protein TadG